ncbi:MAG: ABC transporter permease subunit, partial [Bacteroidota bacterium]
MNTQSSIKSAKTGLWALLRTGIRKNRGARWSFVFLLLLVLVSIFSPFLSNDKPLYAKKDGKIYFPVLREILVDYGLVEPIAEWRNLKWRTETDYTGKIFPPIPYSAVELDVRNARYKGPFDQQRVSKDRYWHRLGTDKLGRDVAAGMIAGTRIALLVGLISMSIATFLGLLLGSLAGYYGDRGLRYRLGQLIGGFVGLVAGVYYGFIFRSTILAFAANEDRWTEAFIISLLLAFGCLSLGLLLGAALSKIPGLNRAWFFPMDWWVMRGVEVFNAVPGLFLLLAIVAVIDQPSVYYVMVVIGFLRWTTIARFTRAEFLKIRELEYIQAGEILGFSDFRIIWRHILPNAIGPILITIAFGM